MISSTILYLPIWEIEVRREERHRTEISPTKVRELADSIARNGLVHSILIDPAGVLVAGEHRLEAFKYLHSTKTNCVDPEYENWTKIPTRIAIDAKPHELTAIELEENIKRTEMTWQDQVRAVSKYHEVRNAMAKGWSAAATAAALGISPGTISRILQVAQELESGNDKISKSVGVTSAYNIISRTKDRQVEAELENLVSTTISKIQEAPQSQETLDGSDGSRSSARSERAICRSDIQHADFLDWADSYQGPRFNLIHCDFPYGINFDTHRGMGSSTEWRDDDALYTDDPGTYWNLTDALIRNRNTIIAGSAHIVFWFSMKYYAETVQAFKNAGFWVFPYPLIWHKSDGKGIIARPDYEPRRSYETALLMSRGERKLVAPTNASYAGPTIKEIHTSEKPEPMLRFFMKMLTDETSEVLDPTCGSGTSIRAAESLGAKRALGLEINPEFCARAYDALMRAVKLRALSNI